MSEEINRRPGKESQTEQDHHKKSMWGHRKFIEVLKFKRTHAGDEKKIKSFIMECNIQ